MYYYHATEIDPRSGLWRFARTDDHHLTPVGYCERCGGHATASAAQAHYHQYLVDTANLDGERPWRERPCEARTGPGCDRSTVCAEPDTRVVRVGPGLALSFALCDAHRNRDSLSDLIPLPRFLVSAS